MIRQKVNKIDGLNTQEETINNQHRWNTIKDSEVKEKNKWRYLEEERGSTQRQTEQFKHNNSRITSWGSIWLVGMFLVKVLDESLESKMSVKNPAPLLKGVVDGKWTN